jgi:WD40 repeat protein
MGCSSEKTEEGPVSENKGYPVCRLSIPITCQIDSMLSYDSKHLILGGINELHMFDFNTNEISLISKGHKGRINCLIKLPDGKVASGGQDSKIKIWDIDKKECVETLEGHSSIIWDIKYINDKIISASDDNSSKIFDLKDKSNKYLFYTRRHISCVAILPNNKVLLAIARNILLFDLETKQQESFLEIKAWTLKTLKNGDVAAGLGNGLLYILKVTDEISIKTEFARGHNSTINTIIELSNEKLVTCSDENDLILWDRTDPESIYFIKGHNNTIRCLCYIEGNKFASIDKDNILKIWE